MTNVEIVVQTVLSRETQEVELLMTTQGDGETKT